MAFSSHCPGLDSRPGIFVHPLPARRVRLVAFRADPTPDALLIEVPFCFTTIGIDRVICRQLPTRSTPSHPPTHNASAVAQPFPILFSGYRPIASVAILSLVSIISATRFATRMK